MIKRLIMAVLPTAFAHPSSGRRGAGGNTQSNTSGGGLRGGNTQRNNNTLSGRSGGLRGGNTQRP